MKQLIADSWVAEETLACSCCFEQGLVHTARCQDLVDVELNWKETPMKPAAFSLGCNATWSTGDYYDLVYQHRHRQRLFVKFFDLLVSLAPNVRRLTMPFDWSERSVRTLSRLRQLDSLTLHQYFWMQSVDPYFVQQVRQVQPTTVRTAPVLCPAGTTGPTNYSQTRSRTLSSRSPADYIQTRSSGSHWDLHEL